MRWVRTTRLGTLPAAHLAMRLLDLYCGVGGSAYGYALAGFDEIVGVDLNPMPNYPFELVSGVHAIDYLNQYGHEFDAIHASPPCQAYTWSAKRWTNIPRHDLVAPTRDALIATNKPYIIENVQGAPLINPIRLCGLMFGEPATREHPKVLRHRLFESNLPLVAPPHPKHTSNGVKQGLYVTVAGHGGENCRGNNRIVVWQEVMGIDWTRNRHELAEAVHPAYTEYLGKQLLEFLC